MKSKSSTEVAKKLNLYISSHGIPKSIYSDSDPDSGNLESFVRSDFINDITSDLVFFCLHSRFDKVIHVMSMVS